jgi:hypothetical protein
VPLRPAREQQLVIVWTAAQHALSRFEVRNAVVHTDFTHPNGSCSDTVAAHLLPSVRDGRNIGGIIGEIDQDGYVFTIDARDQEFFPSRVGHKNPKRHHLLELVVRQDRVCVRKTFFTTPQKRLVARLSQQVKNGFWMEAAALLRMRGSRRVPILRGIDCSNSAIEIEYIKGQSLRHVMPFGADDLSEDESSTERFADALRAKEPGLSAQVSEIFREALGRGVAPRDVHAANFILASDSRLVYMVDFHLSWLHPIPPFGSTSKMLKRMFS